MRDAAGRVRPVQAKPLAAWPDGSVRWLLLDFLVEPRTVGCETWTVVPGSSEQHQRADRQPDPNGWALELFATNAQGRAHAFRRESEVCEVEGFVRTSRCCKGRFPGFPGLRAYYRMTSYPGTGLTRLDVTLHNPRAAKHAGGLWDLGDPGSLYLRDGTLVVSLPHEQGMQYAWKTETAGPEERHSGELLEIFQASSGGPHWRSRTHLNRGGEIPLAFQGYRVRAGGRFRAGLRAEPVVSLSGDTTTLTVACPEFWQQFPRAMEVEGNAIRVRLFPAQHGDLFELQGGEQKTHTVWIHAASSREPNLSVLDGVYRPAHAHADPVWVARTGVLPALEVTPSACARLDALLAEVWEGEQNLLARREIIDEYGWRNFGEIYADHEATYYQGPKPVLSHYNNQYDLVLGTLLQYLRTGEEHWLAIGGPLARHVMDIDIYHTAEDRAAYNHGLFWHTDHYRDAGTATHRSYTRANQPPDGKPYGGGPSNEHNYTSGLLLYFYLTGDPQAAEAVCGLADWVVCMDDGRTTLFSLVDDGPTGFASKTREFDYHGPGRGAGNSVNALLDAWQLTGEVRYLLKAEELIRRCVHPADDVPALDLLDVENRWSYTVFFEVLGRYLTLKAESGQRDFAYAYARASLLHYASWMVVHEKPYFDHPENLEYPTETWAAQDFRKAHVLRLAATHADEQRFAQFLKRGEELADRAWLDLDRFPTRTAARPLAILLTEGLHDARSRGGDVPAAPPPDGAFDFGKPVPFVSQRHRVLQQVRTPKGLLRAGLSLLNPLRWGRCLRLFD